MESLVFSLACPGVLLNPKILESIGRDGVEPDQLLTAQPVELVAVFFALGVVDLCLANGLAHNLCVALFSLSRCRTPRGEQQK